MRPDGLAFEPHLPGTGAHAVSHSVAWASARIEIQSGSPNIQGDARARTSCTVHPGDIGGTPPAGKRLASLFGTPTETGFWTVGAPMTPIAPRESPRRARRSPVAAMALPIARAVAHQLRAKIEILHIATDREVPPKESACHPP